MITWDEAGVDGPIGTIVPSPFATGPGDSNTMRYCHRSTLRTFEPILDVAPLFGDAANASDRSDWFLTFP